MHPGNQLTRVSAIRPDQRQATETAPRSSRGQAFDRSQNQPGAVPILYAGAVNHRPQQQPHRVNNNMTFAPVDLFPGVIAAVTALLT